MSAHALNLLMKRAVQCWSTRRGDLLEWELWVPFLPLVGRVTQDRIDKGLKKIAEDDAKQGLPPRSEDDLQALKDKISNQARSENKANAVKWSINTIQKDFSEAEEAWLDSIGLEVLPGVDGCSPRIRTDAWFVRSVLYDPDGPFRNYFYSVESMISANKRTNENGVKQLFTREFFDLFVKELKKDFRDVDLKGMEVALEDLFNQLCFRMKLVGAAELAEHGPDDWPELGLNDRRITEDYAMGYPRDDGKTIYDRLIDLFTLCVLASIRGPMDYRIELDCEADEQAGTGTKITETGFESSSKRHGRLNTHFELLRVTYDESSKGEQDYVVIDGIEPISLEGFREVRFGRAFPHNTAVEGIRYVSLLDQKLPYEMREWVSREHARLLLNGDNWTIEDWNSSNGVVVSSRDVGASFVIGGKGNDNTSQDLVNGDIIFFGHSEGSGNTDLPCYLFQRSVRLADLPKTTQD